MEGMNLSNKTNKERGLVFEKICKRFGGIQVLLDVSFEASEKMITALIGPNGAGKSTLINLVCGVFPLDSGDIFLNGERLNGLSPCQLLSKGVVRTFQDVRVFPFLSVLDNIMVGLQDQKGENLFHALFRTSAMRRDNKEKQQKAFHILEQLDLEQFAEQPAGEIAFGHKKLVGLARVMASDAKVFLLDEPMAGVEPNMIPKILKILRDLVENRNKIILIIEHNIDVIREIADQLAVLMTKIIAQGSVSTVLQHERVVRDYLGRIAL